MPLLVQAVRRNLDTVEAEGSKPSVPTIFETPLGVNTPAGFLDHDAPSHDPQWLLLVMPSAGERFFDDLVPRDEAIR